MAKMPEHNVPFDRIMLPVIEAYYNAGDTASAGRLGERLFDIMDENMNWYLSLDPSFANKVSDEMGMARLVMQRIATTAKVNGDKALGDRLTTRFMEVDTLYQNKMEDIATMGMRTSTARF